MSTFFLKTFAGEGVKIELYQDGEVVVYQMTGQGIAEQVGTSGQNIDDLLDTLLSPMGLTAFADGSIRNVQALLDAGQVMLPGIVILDGPFETEDDARERGFVLEDETAEPPFPVSAQGFDGLFYVIQRPSFDYRYRRLTPAELGRLKCLIGIKRDVLDDAKEIAGWDAAKAERDAREASRRAAMIEAGFLTPSGEPIIPDGYDDQAW